MRALQSGPVTVALTVCDEAYQFYDGGIMNYDCGEEVNHAVLLVVYGQEGTKKYWILKNSWSDDWGENGFFRLERDDT